MSPAKSLDELYITLLLYNREFDLWLERYLQSADKLTIAKDLVFVYFIHSLFKWYIIPIARDIYRQGPLTYASCASKRVSKHVFKTLLNSPLFKSKVSNEVRESISKLEDTLLIHDAAIEDFVTIPATGKSDAEINEALIKLSNVKHSDYEAGKVSGAVYHGGADLIHTQTNAFKIFAFANQLHPDVFPGVRKIEAEVVSMVLKLFNAPATTGVGGTTSGGTESLLLACLSAKVYGERHRGIRHPEMIIPQTAHAGFDKAAYYFGIKLHHVPVDRTTYKVDINKMRQLINSNTVLLAGSAPNFPHGIIDDIEAIGALGQRYGVPVHVDCCLGSFMIAYASHAGFNDLPLFDFRVPGVTSISCDTHKYGFAPKGSSVIMYRNSALRECQYYVNADWAGGIYGSPTLAGSRPGALIVGCWATMLRVGDDGYTRSSKEIISAARGLKERIKREVPELEVIGDPLVSVVAFKSDKLNVYELSDLLSSKGWHLSTLQHPPALHLALTKLSVSAIDELIEELKAGVKKLISSGSSSVVKSDTSALYGVAGSVQTTGVADKLVVGFLDTLYKTEKSA
jgi:sphinganine-1-phosphate aldolase